MDSTALRSAMRALTRLGIVVESISKFARERERYHPGLHEQISKEVIRRYVDREGNGAFANTAPSVSKRRLGEAGQDLLALVLQFRDTAAAKLSSFAILERVLRDQFEIVDDECGDRDAKRAAIRDPKDVPCDTVGKAEQRIKEGKNAIKWTRLSCRRFRDNAVRLQLHALAYNLANFMRTLALPKEVEYWSLTTLREKLVKIGAKVVSHGRYVTFQLAEVAVPRELFRKILSLIDDLRPRPAPA